jgi:hypothetical protein
MKRTAFILAVLITLVSAAGGCAESATGGTGWELFGQPSVTAAVTATPAPNAFRFRDGIRWGMNKQQVAALEAQAMTERNMQDWSVMLTDGKVAVSMFTADLVFMFREDRLLMISYEFPQGGSDSFQYLTGALGSVYGEKTEAEPLKIKALMDAINPNRYRIEQISQAVCWTAADGTSVYLYYYAQKDFAITYVSPEMGSRIYRTNGL